MESDNWVPLERNPAIEVSERWSVTGTYKRHKVGSEIFDHRSLAESYLDDISPDIPECYGPKNCLINVRDEAGKLIRQEYAAAADRRCPSG